MKFKLTESYGQPPNIPWWKCLNMSEVEIAKYNEGFMKEEVKEMANIYLKNECYCPKCDTINITTICPRCDVRFVGKSDTNVYERQIWNEAIEAAAVKVNEELGADETDSYYVEREIRKLKK